MGCTNCSIGGGVPRGCKNNGTCSSGGCNKLDVFNWLGNMILPPGQKVFEIVEVRFKNSRKGFYRYKDAQNLYVGDAVVVDAAPGIDVGVVSIVGDLVRIQLNKKAPDFKVHDAKEILRKATQEDLDMWKEARGLEFDTMHRARKHAAALGLEMKISDVEYQADKTKATFYYTAENRVDFRELIRVLASDFKTKIEMRQIGARQEAQRLGGIGSCGRELCCSTWLTDFRTVSTSAARYQQLSINPQKLAGQCGKLKCCLNYELDMYIEVVKDFPSTETKLFTQKGRASHIKTDVFKGEMWYLHESNDGEAVGASMVVLSPERVREIIAMNKAGEKPADLKDFQLEKEVSPKEENYSNVVGQDSLDRFDDNFKKKKKKKKDKERQTQESDKPVADATHPEQRTQQMNNLNKVQASEEGDAPKMDTGAKRNQQNQGSNTQVKAQHENDLGHKDNKGQNQRNKSNQLDESNAPEGSVERKKVNKTNKNRNKKRNRNKPNENSAGATLE